MPFDTCMNVYHSPASPVRKEPLSMGTDVGSRLCSIRKEYKEYGQSPAKLSELELTSLLFLWLRSSSAALQLSLLTSQYVKVK